MQILGNVLEVLVVDSGRKAGRHIKILVKIDLTQVLARGIKLKYKNSEVWIQFKYKQLSSFFYYCGCIAYSDRTCSKRNEDLSQNCLKEHWFGGCLRAFTGRAMAGGIASSSLS